VKVTPYLPDATSFARHLVPLLDRLYPSAGTDAFFRHGYAAAFDYCLGAAHLRLLPLAADHVGAPVGHLALILDDRLAPGEAFFGFLEVADDARVFDALWRELCDLARSTGVRRLLGPVNGSIWHQYRCVTETSEQPPFPTEPRTPLWYYRFLKAVGPSKEIGYSSGLRRSYERMLSLMEGKAAKIEPMLKARGFDMAVEREVSARTLHEIAALSDATFRGRSWGYTPLRPTDFAKLHSEMADSPHFHRAFLLRRQGQLIGYAITLRDGPAMICKTICLLPEYQSIGLGNALALYLHRAARQDGLTKVMYVLVRDGNRIHDFPMDDIVIFRRYAAFEYRCRELPPRPRLSHKSALNALVP
jgi:GNAT superfamily N-acetyltransferase